MRVQDVMTTTAAFCHPDANLAVVTASMWEHNCWLLPGVNDQGKVAGVITDRDLCIALGTRDKRACEISVRDVAYRAAVLFRAGTLQLFQITFAGSKCQSESWTRASLYAGTRALREESCLQH